MVMFEWIAGGVAIWLTGMWVASYLYGRFWSYDAGDAPFPQICIICWPAVPVLAAVIGPCVLLGVGVYKGWQLGQSRRQVRKMAMHVTSKEIIEQ